MEPNGWGASYVKNLQDGSKEESEIDTVPSSGLFRGGESVAKVSTWFDVRANYLLQKVVLIQDKKKDLIRLAFPSEKPGEGRNASKLQVQLSDSLPISGLR